MGIGKTIGKATVTGLLCGGLVTGAGSAYGNERFNNFAAEVARGMIRQGYESSVDEAARRSYGNRRGSGDRNRRDNRAHKKYNNSNRPNRAPTNNGFRITPSEKFVITQIRRMPRIIHRGDVDGDGLEDLDFCKPGINDCYPARRWFGNSDKTSWDNFKSSEFFKEEYFYWENGERKPVPKDTLIIPYHKPGINLN